jgi:HK97 family phage prohead protease
MKERTYGFVTKAYEIEKQVPGTDDPVPTGVVAGYLATWDVDRANDRFVPGAFAESIANLRERGRKLRLLRNHGMFSGDALIGGFDPEKLREDERGLFGEAELNLLVERARDAYALAKQGVLADFSVGFSAEMPDVEIASDGVRVFKKATLWETSLVDEPMNPAAQVVSVRSTESVGEWLEAVARILKEDRMEPSMESELERHYYKLSGGEASPLVRGHWTWDELQALPISLRRHIISSQRLSNEAARKLLDAAYRAEQGASKAGKESRMKMDEEKASAFREMLSAKRQACELMGNLIEDESEDMAENMLRVLASDTERNAKMVKMFGDQDEESKAEEAPMDETEEVSEDEAKMLIDSLKGSIK